MCVTSKVCRIIAIANQKTTKVEVLRPFAQEEELAEKMGRLAALNALLNMDEKGDNVAGLDEDVPKGEGGEQEASNRQEEEPDDYWVVPKPRQTESVFEKQEMETKVADASVPYPAEHVGDEHMAGHGNPQELKPAASMTDKLVQRVSIKERLEAFRLKVTEAKKQEKHMEKKKEEVL